MVCPAADSHINGVPVHLPRLACVHWTSGDGAHDSTQHGHCFDQQEVPGGCGLLRHHRYFYTIPIDFVKTS